MTDIIRMPERARAYCDGRWRTLTPCETGFAWQNLSVTIRREEEELRIGVRAPGISLERIELRFETSLSEDVRLLGDAWERAYGDLRFESIIPERVMPWYFIAVEGSEIGCCGVKTQPNALCYWQADPRGVSLTLDVRCGGCGVQLGEKTLEAASIVTLYEDDKPLFAVMQNFCRRMCDNPRTAGGPIYGGNNWYYAYGRSSQQQIVEDAKRVKALAPADGALPFMVIDSCWQKHCYDEDGNFVDNCAGGPYTQPNRFFGDMAQLAADIKALGVRPGIWMRPVQVHEPVPESWLLPQRTQNRRGSYMRALDPTVPEALARIRSDVAMIAGWGYELIKHDFSTNDILGGWGKDYHANVTNGGWHFADTSLTTAQALKLLYTAIREGAGESTLILGCNVMGHLAAGLIESQRTGDDTSGINWERTRYMGVNTLAFRMCQHGTFFDVDADCVGLTKQVPWSLNRQWMDALAKSGTPLFVSADPEAMGDEQTEAVRKAFETASRPQHPGVALDLLSNSCPELWSFESGDEHYDWYDGFAACQFPLQ